MAKWVRKCARFTGPPNRSSPEPCRRPKAPKTALAKAISLTTKPTLPLQLTLAALQANDLDVEEMAGLYRRARGYLDRCEVLLTKVEEEVMVWNEGSETPVPLSDSP